MLDLARGEVCLWWARPQVHAAWVELLDDVEHARMNRFQRPADQARFLTGAAIARCIFAADLEMPPSRIGIDRSCPDCARPHGRVRMVPEHNGTVEVSVSHSGDWVLVAATRDHAIGVDVERVDPDLDHLAVGRLVLRDEELAELTAVAEPDRASWFTRCWVRKEAVVKALGLGLRLPLRDFVGSGAPDVPSVVRWPDQVERDGRVQVSNLECDRAHRAAVALVDAPITRVTNGNLESLIRTAIPGYRSEEA